MGWKNREIEVKLLVEKENSLARVNSVLSKHFKSKSKNIVRGASKDVYWEANKSSKADFIRLRYFPDGLAQITVKHTDKGDNLDRVEIDLEVDDPDKATLILSSLQGNPIGEITKEYVVYFLDKKETAVSVYQIANDSRVFVEVEARTRKEVFKLIKDIEKVLAGKKLTRVTKSLYQIFLKNKKKK